MASFKDFKKQVDAASDQRLSATSSALAQARAVAISSISSTLLASGLSVFGTSSKAEKFARKATDLVEEDAFTDELSDKIGLPQAEESEDEFVERSSSIMRDMLYKKLGVKH